MLISPDRLHSIDSNFTGAILPTLCHLHFIFDCKFDWIEWFVVMPKTTRRIHTASPPTELLWHAWASLAAHCHHLDLHANSGGSHGNQNHSKQLPYIFHSLTIETPERFHSHALLSTAAVSGHDNGCWVAFTTLCLYWEVQFRLNLQQLLECKGNWSEDV